LRRTSIVMLTTCVFTVATAAAGLAQGQSYPPPSGPASVAGAGGATSDGTAFTGGELATPVIATALLLALATVVLVVARRRSRMFQGTS
jgi:hypothetical protein